RTGREVRSGLRRDSLVFGGRFLGLLGAFAFALAAEDREAVDVLTDGEGLAARVGALLPVGDLRGDLVVLAFHGLFAVDGLGRVAAGVAHAPALFEGGGLEEQEERGHGGAREDDDRHEGDDRDEPFLLRALGAAGLRRVLAGAHRAGRDRARVHLPLGRRTGRHLAGVRGGRHLTGVHAGLHLRLGGHRRRGGLVAADRLGRLALRRLGADDEPLRVVGLGLLGRGRRHASPWRLGRLLRGRQPGGGRRHETAERVRRRRGPRGVRLLGGLLLRGGLAVG